MLVEKTTKGKRQLGRPRHRWENSIKSNFGEMGCEGVDWFHLAGFCVHDNEHSDSIKCELTDYKLFKNDSTPWS
jgi:hypothetical protein